jgi:hypothetical protein
VKVEFFLNPSILWLPIGSYGRFLVFFKIQNLANLGFKKLFVDVVRSFFSQNGEIHL